MHIRKLDIRGFKSFPDRVGFDFSDGISAVVGPNGCGKSNVLEAMKWCIGEQSPRELRSRAMEDVIFSGSDAKAAMGLAEVGMTLVAGKRPFAGDWARYEEIHVSRSLARGATSVYRMNQQRVRLRDVQELFMDTGVGSRFYSFIEQGRIGDVVQASAAERRGLIEEAAGTSRFKARRAETLKRLDKSLENLRRSVHVVQELEERLEGLAREVARAARFRRLRAIAAQGTLFLALSRYVALLGDRRALSADRRASAGRVERCKRELGLRQADLRRDRELARLAEQAVGRRRDRLADLEASRRELESARIYQDRERRDLLERAERLTVALEREKGRVEEAQEEGRRATGELQELQARLDEEQRGQRELQQRSDQAGAKIRQLRQEEMERQRLVMKHRTALERARARIEDLQRLGEEIRQGVVRHQRDVAAADDEAQRLADARSSAQNLERTAQQRLATLVSAVEEQEAQTRSLLAATQQARLDQGEAERALTALERQHAGAQARRDSLQQLQARHEGLTSASRRVLDALPGSFAVAEELEVAEALEAQLAALLSERVDLVGVADRQQLLQARQAVGSGVAWLLDLSAPGDEPVAGLVSEVGGSRRAQRALARLLGEVRSVPDLEQALLRAEEGGANVTPDGCVVWPGGLVRMGQRNDAAGALLGRRRALRQAEASCDELAARCASAQDRCQAARQGTAQAESAAQGAGAVLEERKEARRVAELEAAGLAHRLRSCGEAEQHHQRAVRQLESTGERQAQRLEAQQQELERWEATVVVEEEALQRAEEEVRALVGQLETAYAAQREVRSALQRAGEALAALQERLRAGRRAQQAAERELGRAAEAVEAAQEEAQRVATRQVELAEQVQQTEQRVGKIATQQEEASTALEQERQQLRRSRSRVQRSEEVVAEAAEEQMRASQTLQEVELALAETRTRLEGLRQQAEEEQGVSLPSMLDRLEKNGQLLVPHGLEDERRLPVDVKRLPVVEVLVIEPTHLEDGERVRRWSEASERARRALTRLGDVNLTAVESYLELRARYEELEAQRQDLAESVAEIRAALARINRTCRHRFRDTFDAVNQHFEALYRRLAGGGSASLLLTDEQDLLETGVEILASPPGKRLRNLNLLSGGEKALVAIALIFALFEVKPSPFCILDEVDAPLDEGNGARFNELLRDMARVSQFVIITHNKKTIECADTLYGVTMQQAGISKLVSVRMH